MPTAARLVGAIYFAGLAFLLSSMIIPYLPDQMRLGYFTPINCGVGLIAGWRVMGPRARGTVWNAMAGGITTAIAMFLVALLVHAGVQMVELALRKRYDSVVEAIIGVIEEAWKYFLIVGAGDILLTLVIGGVIGGLFSRTAANSWN